ncbi:tagaturonate reductase [Neobacillus cucumis]|uniref:tagaturonate reductase n=1 Tax=Neobacillus cucumis TaxID=1740721 RepID=UPI00285305FB|nr:tagaturonate reductase [Neobacillus cucumis]MDR4949813.1 tagaturonate reductase [Neobacillus cucumis]
MQKLTKETWKDYKEYPEKVIQFGEGNFLRAFADWIIDKMNKETNFNGSVVVVQPREHGTTIHKLNEQDGLFTLYLQGIKNKQAVREHSVINCISRGINTYTDYSQYLELAENPELRFIISNTTEAGIYFEENDKLEDQPQKSYPGRLTALLYQRFKAFEGDTNKGFIIIPCELIDRNGEKLKEIVLNHAVRWNLGEEFVNWINEANTFCCSLVDRIVTGYPSDTINEITEELGYKDDLVVVGEQYHLWVIEGPDWIKDEFPTDKAGLNVKFVKDLTPYRSSKVRILNGAHSAMTPVAYLYGLDTVGEAVTNEVTKKFVEELIYEEVIPVLDLPEKELKLFAEAVLERFMNPFVNHYLSSIALNSMSKFKTRDLPSLLEYYDKKMELPKKLTFSLSALICYYKGKRGEEEIQLKDDQDILDLYKSLWQNYDGTESSLKQIVISVLAYEKVWGINLNNVPMLTEAVTRYLLKIENLGMKEAIKEVTRINSTIEVR